MNYDTFKEKVEDNKYATRKDNVDLFNQLTINEYRSYWIRFMKREILRDRSSDIGNTHYMLEQFFGKEKGRDFCSELFKNMKLNFTPINFGILLNINHLTLEEKIDLIQQNNEKITVRHWQYFFNYLSYEGSKLLPEISKSYNFKKFSELKSFNNAFFNVFDKIDFQPYDERKNKAEKEHISRINMQARLFIELANLGLDPSAKVKRLPYYENSSSGIEYIIQKKQLQLLNKILYLNVKQDNPFLLKNEAAMFAYRLGDKGINRDTMFKLLSLTKPEYLMENFNKKKKNIEIILEKISYASSYHEKNIKLLFNMLSMEDPIKDATKINIRLEFFEKFKNYEILNIKQKEIIESIIAKDQKFLIEQILKSNPVRKENKARL